MQSDLLHQCFCHTVIFCAFLEKWGFSGCSEGSGKWLQNWPIYSLYLGQLSTIGRLSAPPTLSSTQNIIKHFSQKEKHPQPTSSNPLQRTVSSGRHQSSCSVPASFILWPWLARMRLAPSSSQREKRCLSFKRTSRSTSALRTAGRKKKTGLLPIWFVSFVFVCSWYLLVLFLLVSLGYDSGFQIFASFARHFVFPWNIPDYFVMLHQQVQGLSLESTSTSFTPWMLPWMSGTTESSDFELWYVFSSIDVFWRPPSQQVLNISSSWMSFTLILVWYLRLNHTVKSGQSPSLYSQVSLQSCWSEKRTRPPGPTSLTQTNYEAWLARHDITPLPGDIKRLLWHANHCFVELSMETSTENAPKPIQKPMVFEVFLIWAAKNNQTHPKPVAFDAWPFCVAPPKNHPKAVKPSRNPPSRPPTHHCASASPISWHHGAARAWGVAGRGWRLEAANQARGGYWNPSKSNLQAESPKLCTRTKFGCISVALQGPQAPQPATS